MIEKLLVLLPVGNVTVLAGTSIVLLDVAVDATVPVWFVGLLLTALGWLLSRTLGGIEARCKKVEDQVNDMAQDLSALRATVEAKTP